MQIRGLWLIIAMTSLSYAGSIEGKITAPNLETVPTGAVVFVELLDGEPSAYVIGIKDRTFIPQVAIVPRGVAVEFHNSGNIAHNLYARSGANTFVGGRLDPGERERFTFKETGLVEVHCKVYGDMKGIVLVRDRVAWTDVAADGSFRLSQLAPGVYRLGAWVPGYPYIERQVTVIAHDKATIHLAYDAPYTPPSPPVVVAPLTRPQVKEAVADVPKPEVVTVEQEQAHTQAEPESVAINKEPETSEEVESTQLVAEVAKPTPETPSTGTLVGQISTSGDAAGDPIVVWLTGSNLTAPSQVNNRFEIVTKNKQFVPHVLAVPKGAKVHFPNSDPIIHNVFSVSGANAFDAGRYPEGQGVSHQFEHEGLVKVFCNVHHEMNAYIMIADTPHIAYVGPNGKFQFQNLLPGEYSIQAFHPHGKLVQEQVRIVAAQTANAQLSLSLKEKRIAHRNKIGKRYKRANSEAY